MIGLLVISLTIKLNVMIVELPLK